MKRTKVLFALPLAILTAWALSSSPRLEAAVSDTQQEIVVDDDHMALAASNCTYYNNAAHTQVVGQVGYDCCNNRVAWGRTSPFYVCGGCCIC